MVEPFAVRSVRPSVASGGTTVSTRLSLHRFRRTGSHAALFLLKMRSNQDSVLKKFFSKPLVLLFFDGGLFFLVACSDGLSAWQNLLRKLHRRFEAHLGELGLG